VQVVFEDLGTVHELDVTIGHPQASVGDLAAALRVRGRELVIDGRPVPAGTGLDESGLVVGSTVRATRVHQPQVPPPVVVVRVVGGLSAGHSFNLGPGRALVGRDEYATVVVKDRSVSREHCQLDVTPTGQVTLTDLGSSNGTDVNGVRVTAPVAIGPDDIVSLGGGVLLRVLPAAAVGRVVAVDPLREARPGGVIPFSRAPRAVEQDRYDPIPLPVKPEARSGMTFSIAALVGPLVMAGALVAISQDLRYAAIAALTPLMMLANLVEDRTRGRRSVRRKVREFTAEVDRVRELLHARRATEVRRRRNGLPDPAEAVARTTGPGVRLWERRPGMPDFMELTAGHADLPWSPAVRADRGEPAEEVAEILRECSVLPDVPVPVRLTAGGVLGLTGDRRAGLAVARSLLCQAVTTSGPADLTVAVFTDYDRAGAWDWTKWLPHVLNRRGGEQPRLLAAGPEAADALARSLLASAAQMTDGRDPGGPERTGPVVLVVVDGRALLEGRPCPLRELLTGRGGFPAAGIVLTDRLPAACTMTMHVAADGSAQLHRLTTDEMVSGMVATGMSEPAARRAARALARFEDPELRTQGAGLPDRVTLLPLLGMPDTSSRAVLDRWRAGAASLRARGEIGVTERDVFAIDLDDDGPHGLIAGTTGSGKSELLRTLVASLAMGNDPQHLTFALIDYKGEAGLGPCAPLPHALGMVSSLENDPQLGARTLRCLEAELRYRERLLHSVGLSHIRDYQRLRDTERPELEPLPRLVVVIDEFAEMVKKLPGSSETVDRIGRLGRALGVHMILATQRPAGVVNDSVKNNVKLRIALRVESASDSQDIIDNPIAATIGGRQWGRAYYRVSAQEALPVQTALSTGVSAGGVAEPVTVAPFLFQPVIPGSVQPGTPGSFQPGTPGGQRVAAGPEGLTDLEILVAAAQKAYTELGAPPLRPPWPDPLPEMVPADQLGEAAQRGLCSDTRGLPPLALADDPDHQTRYPVGWDPRAGNLLLYGAVGSGTTTALAWLALSLCRHHSPDDLHLYVLDIGAGELAPLQALPHVGAHIGSVERERQTRLIGLLRRELDRRKAAAGRRTWPTWVTLIDNVAALRADHDDVAGMRLMDDLDRVYADGPVVDIHIVAAADRAGSVPSQWAAVTQQKLLLRLADSGEYSYFELHSSAVPRFVPGRAVTPGGQVLQIGWPGGDLAAATAAVAGRWPGARRSARPIGLLPTEFSLRDLRAAARTAEEPWLVPVGLSADDLEPIGLPLYEHEHALIAGPPRSGRSTTLCTIAASLKTSPVPPRLIGFAPRRSRLRDCAELDRLVESYADLGAVVAAEPDGFVLLIDDADTFDDDMGSIASLVNAHRPGVHLFVAGRADTLRRSFGHWTQAVRASRSGILLVPDIDLDGDLLSVELPRTQRPLPVAGRGFLAFDGQVTGVQVAHHP